MPTKSKGVGRGKYNHISQFVSHGRSPDWRSKIQFLRQDLIRNYLNEDQLNFERCKEAIKFMLSLPKEK